jgi:hypothetical protein
VRVIAIDWSGAKVGAAKKIWLGEATASGALIDLKTGLNREQVTAYLINEAGRGEPMVVGLDFAFSFPAWFVRERGYASAPALWAGLATDGLADAWLKTPKWPLWGRKGHTKPTDIEHFRATENDVGAVAGISCKSVFQIGGAGAVGTGSIRGMPVLHRLRAVGLGAWPFDAQARATAIEIYPRLLTGPVKKSVGSCRWTYMVDHFPHIRPETMEVACSSEDAFDAAVSALVMAQHADELKRLPRRIDAQTLIEGEIWRPGIAS